MGAGPIHWIRLVGGLIWLVVGSLWALQGWGLVPGSFMSGRTQWLIIGIVVALFGIVLIWLGLRERLRR